MRETQIGSPMKKWSDNTKSDDKACFIKTNDWTKERERTK